MTASPALRIVIPNDWNGVYADESRMTSLRQRAVVVAHRGPPESQEALIEQLREADIVVGIRERTQFDAALPALEASVQMLGTIGTTAATNLKAQGKFVTAITGG